MKQDYLTPFFKKANLHIPITLYLENLPMSNKGLNDLPSMEDMPVSGGGILKSSAKAVGSIIAAPLSIAKGTGDYIGKKIYRSTVSKENVLALMITDAIISGLKKSNVYLKDKNKRDIKIKEDMNKIKRLTISNAIDLKYGGGILVFGPNFNIQKMIHIFYNTETKPVYFSKEIGDTMEDNVVNENLTKSKLYSSANIIQEIKDVIK
jgi:hypothetical protein